MELAAEQIAQLFQDTFRFLDERQRRLVAGALAKALGRGGKTAVAAASGMSRNTIIRGERDLAAGDSRTARLRRSGAGAKRADELQPGLRRALEALVQPENGGPASPLRWTVRSSVALARELAGRGFQVSDDTVRRLLDEDGYTRRAVRGRWQPHLAEPSAQFAYVDEMAACFIAEGQPVVSVDATIGLHVARSDEVVDPGLLSAASPVPPVEPAVHYGWGPSDADDPRARLTIDALGDWWASPGAARFPTATSMLVAVHGAHTRARFWEIGLAGLVTGTGLDVTICHMPPGIWKWSRVEHRLKTVVVSEWEGGLVSADRTVVELVSAPDRGPLTKAELGAFGRMVSPRPDPADAWTAETTVDRHEFEGDWNYTVKAGVTRS